MKNWRKIAAATRLVACYFSCVRFLWFRQGDKIKLNGGKTTCWWWDQICVCLCVSSCQTFIVVSQYVSLEDYRNVKVMLPRWCRTRKSNRYTWRCGTLYFCFHFLKRHIAREHKKNRSQFDEITSNKLIMNMLSARRLFHFAQFFGHARKRKFPLNI